MAEVLNEMPGPSSTLNDGREFRVRLLHPDDRGMYQEAVEGLSPRSRYLRFAAPMPSITKSLLDRMMQLDGVRHVAYAALTPDEMTIVGVARFVRLNEPHVAEVAIAIADDWQCRGLGVELVGRVVEHARATGLVCLVATTLSENRAAARLARSTGFSVVRTAGIHTLHEMCLDAGVIAVEERGAR